MLSFFYHFIRFGLGSFIKIGWCSLMSQECNVPKPICQEHHGFGVFLNFYWLWYFVKHFAYSDPLGYA
jgi:hypothetical protein